MDVLVMFAIFAIFLVMYILLELRERRINKAREIIAKKIKETGDNIENVQLGNSIVADSILTKCPVCNGIISSEAMSCPHCGHPIKLIQIQEKRKSSRAIAITFIVIIVVIVVLVIVRSVVVSNIEATTRETIRLRDLLDSMK